VTAARPALERDATELLVEELTTLFARLAILARSADDGPALNTTQRLALIALAAAEPIRLQALAARIDTSSPTASRAVEGLVEAGLAERVTDPEDRRAVQIRLTDHGRGLIGERRRRVAATLEPALLTLPAAERARLVALLAGLNSALPA